MVPPFRDCVWINLLSVRKPIDKNTLLERSFGGSAPRARQAHGVPFKAPPKPTRTLHSVPTIASLSILRPQLLVD
jgi:hypothetical protein